MVKKYLFILAATALTFTSCIKDDSTEGGDGDVCNQSADTSE